MKLRNKKTGEIKECVVIPKDINGYPNEYEVFEKADSLAELIDEWEDYEESKEYWFIKWCGEVDKETDDGVEVDKECKEIGNYFETKEEAEKAVEKLKAWKRLKDKGFKFLGYGFKVNDKGIIIKAYCPKGFIDDLNLLFGGEE